MSSVATRRCWEERRIACWRASLRENTTTCRGRPISPSSRRRTSTWPSEPVPPVTTTFLPSSKRISPRVRGRPRGKLGHHLLPWRGRPARRLAQRRGVQAAVDAHTIVGHDLDLETQRFAQSQQQLLLCDRLGADVPEAAEPGVAVYELDDQPREHGRGRP